MIKVVLVAVLCGFIDGGLEGWFRYSYLGGPQKDIDSVNFHIQIDVQIGCLNLAYCATATMIHSSLQLQYCLVSRLAPIMFL